MTVGAVEARFAGEPRRCTAKRTDQRGRRRIVYGLLLSLLIASAACSKRKAVDAAEDAARDWLALVDAGEYERAWEQASSGMRQREAKDEWVNATSQARAAVPGASTRLVYDRVVAKDSTEDHMLVNLVFRVSDEQGRGLGEFVGMVRERGGAWQVAGYMVVGGRGASS